MSTYVNQSGEVITVETLEYLESGSYWDEDEGEWMSCSRYYIGEADGDSQSVWLNEFMREVDV